jgi:hypothetical protein
MARLTWADLLIENITAEQFKDWISPWAGVVSGRVAPAYLNKFGSWFLRRPEGHVEMLDVFTGQLFRVADSYEEFMRNVNERAWQEEFLLSELVYELHLAGKIPGPAQCYLLAPHPAIGGPIPAKGNPIDTKFVMVGDIAVWQSICAQMLARTVENSGR